MVFRVGAAVAAIPGDLVYVSSTSGGNVGGVSFNDEDIMVVDTATGVWAMYVDGSDLGLTATGQEIDGLHVKPDGSVLFTLGAADNLAGVGPVDDHDVLLFTPTSTGPETSGTLSMYFNGEDHQLTTSDEDLDAISLAPDGALIVSTRGSYNVGSLSGGDEDLLRFDNGTWSLYMDGRAVGLNKSGDDVNGLNVSPTGEIAISLRASYTLGNASGTRADIASCAPQTPIPVTSCGWVTYWNGADWGFDTETLNGFTLVSPDTSPQPPNAADDSAETPQDTAVAIDVAANDSDPNGDLDPTTANSTCTGGSNGCAGATNGTLTDNGNGTITYTPNPGFSGVDSFVYEICDSLGNCATATVTVTVVSATGNPPQANDDFAGTVHGESITISAVANDTDVDGDLSPITANISCNYGSTGCAGPTSGSVSNLGGGSFSYTPDGTATGPDTFTYEVCDSQFQCDTAVVTIQVGDLYSASLIQRIVSSNWSPPSTDSSAIVNFPGSSDLLVADSEINENSNYQGVNLFSINNTGTVLSTASSGVYDNGVNEPAGMTIDPATGKLFLAEDSPNGGQAIYVVDPGADNTLFTGDDTRTWFLTLSFGSFDPEGLTFRPASGTLFIIDGLGNMIYELSPGANGVFDGVSPGGDDQVVSTVSTSRFGVIDPEGIAYNPTSDTLYVGGTTPNVGPTKYDYIAEINLSGNLVRWVDATAFTSFEGSRRISGLSYGPGSTSPANVLWVADRGASEASVPGQNDGRVYELSLPLSGPQPPIAVNDSASTPQDTPIDVDVAANDSDPNGDLDPNTANPTCDGGSAGCVGAANGTLVDNNNGTINYTPNPGFNGVDSFVYEICDTLGNCATATVTIDVVSSQSPPVAVNDSANTLQDTPIDVDVAANDSDPNGDLDPNTANPTCDGGSAGCVGAANGTLVDNNNGTINYTPNPGFNGVDSFVYEICDTLGNCATATASVTVVAVNQSTDWLYIGTTSSALVGGVSFADEDIVLLDLETEQASLYIDGSDIGLGARGQEIDAFHVYPNGSVLLSIGTSATLPGVGAVDDYDIVLFTPTSTGANTAGTYTMFFNGEDHGLSTSNDDIDAIAIAPDGSLIISTRGTARLPGFNAADEDLSRLANGTWSLYLDGSAVELESGAEDVNGLNIATDGTISVSVRGSYAAGGLVGTSSDILNCVPGNSGPITACTWSSYWDATVFGLDGKTLNGITIIPKP